MTVEKIRSVQRKQPESVRKGGSTIVYGMWGGEKMNVAIRYKRTQTGYDCESPPFDVKAFQTGSFIENTHGIERFNSINPLQED